MYSLYVLSFPKRTNSNNSSYLFFYSLKKTKKTGGRIRGKLRRDVVHVWLGELGSFL